MANFIVWVGVENSDKQVWSNSVSQEAPDLLMDFGFHNLMGDKPPENFNKDNTPLTQFEIRRM